MISCDLCKKELVAKKNVWIEAGKNADKHICVECIQICNEIVKNPKLQECPVVSLNEYKEEKEQGKL